MPAGIRGHCAGHLLVPFKPLYTRAYANVPGDGTFGRRRAEPSRAEANVFTATAYSNSWKKERKKNERKKERKNSFRLLFEGAGVRVPLGNREITDRFRDRFHRYRPT